MGLRAWLTLAVVAAAVLGLSWAAWRIDARAYDRGVRDEKIRVQSQTELLNDALREAQQKARTAALDAQTRARELTELERELADERARDPLADGLCMSPDGLSRIFRVR